MKEKSKAKASTKPSESMIFHISNGTEQNRTEPSKYTSVSVPSMYL